MMKRRKYGAQLRLVIYHWRHTVEAHAHNWKAASSLSRSRPRFLPSEGKENEAGQPNKRFQMSSKCAFGRFMRIATFMFIISLRAANCNLTVIFFKKAASSKKRRTTLGLTASGWKPPNSLILQKIFLSRQCLRRLLSSLAKEWNYETIWVIFKHCEWSYYYYKMYWNRRWKLLSRRLKKTRWERKLLCWEKRGYFTYDYGKRWLEIGLG